MIEQRNQFDNSNNENEEIDSNSTNSEQSNDSSFSFKNMSIIDSLLDNDEKNYNKIQEINNNKINQNYTNNFTNSQFINGINSFNYDQIQQINNLNLYNQYLYMNKQIQQFNIIQILMNILTQEKNKNFSIHFSNKKFNKTKKNKINNNILGNISNNKKIPPKPENEIIIKLILSGKEKRTYIRLSPIPNKYSPFDIIKLIDRYLKTKKGERIYNSLYVPLAKVIGKNKGYCFVNLVSPKYVVEFYKIFNGLNFNIKNCRKPCSVVFSDNQNIDCSNDDALKRPIIFNDVVKH